MIVTYPDDQKGYRHPDHLRVYDITIPAWQAAGEDADPIDTIARSLAEQRAEVDLLRYLERLLAADVNWLSPIPRPFGTAPSQHCPRS